MLLQRCSSAHPGGSRDTGLPPDTRCLRRAKKPWRAVSRILAGTQTAEPGVVGTPRRNTVRRLPAAWQKRHKKEDDDSDWGFEDDEDDSPYREVVGREKSLKERREDRQRVWSDNKGKEQAAGMLELQFDEQTQTVKAPYTTFTGDEPQWFVLEFLRADPGKVGRTAGALKRAVRYLRGAAAVEDLTTHIPRKTVTAPDVQTGAMKKVEVTWQRGRFLFFKTVMDDKLGDYIDRRMIDHSAYYQYQRIAPDDYRALPQGGYCRGYTQQMLAAWTANESEVILDKQDRLLWVHRRHVPLPDPGLYEEALQWAGEEEVWDVGQLRAYLGLTPEDISERQRVKEAHRRAPIPKHKHDIRAAENANQKEVERAKYRLYMAQAKAADYSLADAVSVGPRSENAQRMRDGALALVEGLDSKLAAAPTAWNIGSLGGPQRGRPDQRSRQDHRSRQATGQRVPHKEGSQRDDSEVRGWARQDPSDRGWGPGSSSREERRLGTYPPRRREEAPPSSQGASPEGTRVSWRERQAASRQGPSSDSSRERWGDGSLPRRPYEAGPEAKREAADILSSGPPQQAQALSTAVDASRQAAAPAATGWTTGRGADVQQRAVTGEESELPDWQPLSRGQGRAAPEGRTGSSRAVLPTQAGQISSAVRQTDPVEGLPRLAARQKVDARSPPQASLPSTSWRDMQKQVRESSAADAPGASKAPATNATAGASSQPAAKPSWRETQQAQRATAADKAWDSGPAGQRATPRPEESFSNFDLVEGPPGQQQLGWDSRTAFKSFTAGGRAPPRAEGGAGTRAEGGAGAAQEELQWDLEKPKAKVQKPARTPEEDQGLKKRGRLPQVISAKTVRAKSAIVKAEKAALQKRQDAAEAEGATDDAVRPWW